MYIFQFFLKSANSLADGIYCACCWTSQEGTEEAAAPLLEAPSRERPRSYNSLSENSELGLTATYESWFESKDALPYALGHLFMYMVLAVVGFSFVLEQWPIYNSIYFAVVVFTTVGKHLCYRIVFSSNCPTERNAPTPMNLLTDYLIFSSAHSFYRIWRLVAYQ